MSFGLHRFWKEHIFDFLNAEKNEIFLDLAGGSGDISKIITKKFPENKCVLVDNNNQMILEAKNKLKGSNVDFVCAESEKLPFKSQSFDYIIVSFGLRNFSNINSSLFEIQRCLKKNGLFICLEFSNVNRKSLRFLTELYYEVIPKLGKVFVGNEFAYKYLVESIKNFPNQIELTKKLIKSGFKKVECFDLMGGIASIHLGKK